MTRLVRTAVKDIAFHSLAKLSLAVEVQAGLKQVSSTAVLSFHLGKLGFGDLIKKKYTTLNTLSENLIKLKTYVREADYPLDGDTAILVHSLMLTTKADIDTIRGHIEKAIQLSKSYQ